MPTPFPTIARLREHFTDPPPTDAELLGRFATSRDDDAFRELVRRHGPAVLAVCRRVTGNRDDADDAFQAAFLVLARKPDRVRPGSPLGGWLYGVAVRAARKAVARSARRRSWETAAGELPEVPDRPPATDPETVRAVLEEVARLSDAYRSAVVLCELEGRSRADAARELGIAEGTLSSRLAAARKVLARRFRDRGLAPAVLAAVAGSISCPVLAADAARLTRASAPPPPRVEELSEAVMRSAFLSKWKLVPVAAVLAAVGLAVTAAEPQAPVAPKHPLAAVAVIAQPKPVPPAGKPLPRGPNKLLFYRQGHLTLIDPDGKNEKRVSEDRDKFMPGDARLSPDGKQIAFLVQAEENPPAGRGARHALYVRGLDEKEPGTDLGVECQMFFWSPDGTEIAYSDFEDSREKKLEAAHGIVNVKTKEKTPLKLPAGHMITDWSRDGKFFVTTHIDGVVTQEKFPTTKLHLTNRDGTEHKTLTDGKQIAVFGRLSPDGTRVLYGVFTLPKDKTGWPRHEMYVLDVATGKSTRVEDQPLNGEVMGYCWSPDGKKIAYVWREEFTGKPEDRPNAETESFLVVCDADGKNAKTIATEKAKGAGVITIGYVDWR